MLLEVAAIELLLLLEVAASELLALLLEATANELLALLLEIAAIELLDLLLEDVTKLELTEELNSLDELTAEELATELDLLELARLDLSAALDLLLEESPRLELARELDTTLATELAGLVLDIEFKEDDTTTTGLVELEFELDIELTTTELILMELSAVFELELNLFSLDATMLFADDTAFEAWLDAELLTTGVSASSALLNELDVLVPSPSTPAAPPHAVKIIEKIRPQKGSLALFSAKESIFLYH